MSLDSTRPARRIGTAALAAGFLAFTGVAALHAQAPIVQPGLPGEPSREITAAEAADLAGIGVTDADLQFLQGMIPHHRQALEMTALAAERTGNEDLLRLAERIELSQEDEIAMMEGWLRDRGQDVPDADAHHADDWEPMPGMLTADEMAELGAAADGAFDRLFLRRMVRHHRGAVTMVENLLDQRGAAQDPTLFSFASDVTADQSAEIDRMDAMLAGLSEDPRVGLASGFADAGEALWNMALVTTRPKPEGFREPRDPEDAEDADDADDDADADEEEDAAPPRRGLLVYGNTDMAFAEDRLYLGSHHGFHTYRVETPASPQLVSSVVCPGGQGDLSVVGDLIVMSVEQTRGRLDCGLQGVADPVSAERFRGVRVFDISDPRRPQQVAAVQTCRGSHTHTVVADPDDAGNIYVYGSGAAPVRSGDELKGCSDESPAENPETALFRIDVIRIPLARPEEAAIVSRPFVFRDPETGDAAGLWAGGDHGPGTQRTAPSNHCHDITTFPELGIAAGACSGNGILLDISDPVNPVRLDDAVDPGFAYWHSATFNNDGAKVIFTDEWGGGGRPRCRASDPREWGGNSIYDIVDGKLEFRGRYKLPAPQTDRENCVAHNGSLVPVPGRDIMVQAWYQGGVSVFDFTDSANPVEIAFFDRGPLHPERFSMGGFWSAYWYRGYIYGSEIARGLDVLELLPSAHLSENEIAAAASVVPADFNAQQQRRVEWPARPVVARAWLDQLGRGDALADERQQALAALLDRADAAGVSADAALAAELAAAARALEGDAEDAGDASERTVQRLRGLADTLTRLGERLR